MIHPKIVMVTGEFSGRVEGRDEFLSGFRDFSRKATITEFCEPDRQIDVIGKTAVISFRYEMLYDLSGERYQATGRDLWVFQSQEATWLAVW